jgi:hypothetical protein
VRRSPTLLSLTIAASLICTPLMTQGLAHASPLGFAGPAEGASEDPALAEVRALYKQGEIKFQTAEYGDALNLWVRAFGMLPDGDETRSIRHALVYNIAGAHSRAYEVNRDPAHLRKAKILLENYRADHRALYGDEAEAIRERSEVDDRIAELDTMIAASEAAGETSPTVTGNVPPDPNAVGPTPPQPAPAPKPLTPQQQWEAEVKADPTLGPLWVQSQKRIAGGAVLAGIGSFFALISIAAFVTAPSTDDFAGVLWVSGAATGVIALGLIVPGGVLIGAGAGQRRKVLDAKPKPIASVFPMMLPAQPGTRGQPGGGGVGYALRF